MTDSRKQKDPQALNALEQHQGLPNLLTPSPGLHLSPSPLPPLQGLAGGLPSRLFGGLLHDKLVGSQPSLLTARGSHHMIQHCNRLGAFTQESNCAGVSGAATLGGTFEEEWEQK